MRAVKKSAGSAYYEAANKKVKEKNKNETKNLDSAQIHIPLDTFPLKQNDSRFLALSIIVLLLFKEDPNIQQGLVAMTKQFRINESDIMQVLEKIARQLNISYGVLWRKNESEDKEGLQYLLHEIFLFLEEQKKTLIDTIEEKIPLNDIILFSHNSEHDYQGYFFLYQIPFLLSIIEISLRFIKDKPLLWKKEENNDTLIKRIVDESTKYEYYESARSFLMEEIGCYCSYCEQPISSCQVEHILPKSKYPALASYWENLLLACPPCNTEKGTKDGSETLLPLMNEVINPNIYFDLQYFDIFNCYYLLPTHVGVNKAFKFVLYVDSECGPKLNLKEVPFTLKEMQEWHSVDVSYKENVCIVRTNSNPNAMMNNEKLYKIQVRVVPNPKFQGSVDENEKKLFKAAENTIKLFDLNDIHTVSSSGWDIRMLKRTEVWLKALECYSEINKLFVCTSTSINIEVSLELFMKVWTEIFKMWWAKY